jgi:nitrite reductase (NADH) large subunit
MQRVVIIGGGIAGTTAAEELRKRNSNVEITLIQEEQHACYSRVLLPHYIKDKITREKVFLKPGHWYVDKEIEFMPGTQVTAIDLNNRFVATSEGRELEFDKLLIASGGELGLLTDDLRGVSYLRTLDDADHLKILLNEAKAQPNPQAVIYGGGFIACEYANIFKHWNLPFKIIMRGPGFWSQLISTESQSVLRAHAEAQGIEVIVNEPTPELLGESELTGVKLANQRELPAQLLGAGVGLRFDQTFFDQTGLAYNQGLLANEYLETAVPGVYTAGDVAEFNDTIVERQVRYGNWMNAQMQGRVAGANLAGERTAFRLVSSYATNLLDLHVVFLGDVNREFAEVKQTVASPTAAQEVFVRNGKLVGAVLIGDVADRAKLTALIGKNFS